MRVTGGLLGGRKILGPPERVRPTQDRVREALFSMLGDRVPGARFLDLCAGSGAVGIEAWSRGAEFVCWVESDRRVAATLRRNVEALCNAGTRVVCADAVRFLRTGRGDRPFGLVFADPPYPGRADGAGQRLEPPTGWGRVVDSIFRSLADPSAFDSEGLFILEQGHDMPACRREDWVLLEDRAYGRARLCIYRRQPWPTTEFTPRKEERQCSL